MVLHYAPARGGGGRRRRVPDRLGAARPDARALRVRRLSGGEPAGRARRRGARRSSAATPSSPMAPTGPNTARMWSMPTARRGALSARSAVGVGRDRCRRHRLLRAARRLARRRQPSRPRDRRLDLRPRLSAQTISPPARRSTGTMRTTPPARRRRARRSPTGSASPGCSASRICGAAGRSRITSASAASSSRRRPPGCRKASRSGSPRLGCPRGRQGRQPAEHVSRSEIVGRRRAVFLQRRGATT